MKLVLLDAKTMGDDIDLSILAEFGDLEVYETTKREQTIERIRDADIVLTNKVLLSEAELREAKKLKLVTILATGINNIDLEAAKRLGITVKNAKGYSTNSVVQNTFSLLLYLLMKPAFYDLYVKSKEWCKSDIFTDMSRPFWEIHGKKWGIIGLGEIGKSVAKVAKSFGADVSYYSSSGVPRDEEYPHLDLYEIMQSDIISIHAPLNEKTKNLITKKELDIMRPKSILLNLGRGGIVNEQDLAYAIDSKEILVGLDVLESEPPSQTNPLLHITNSDRLFITPHIAWGSIEARRKLLEITAHNIREFIRG